MYILTTIAWKKIVVYSKCYYRACTISANIVAVPPTFGVGTGWLYCTLRTWKGASQKTGSTCLRRQIFHIRLGSPQEEMRAFAVTQTSSPSGATGSCLPTLSFQMSFKERTNAVCDSLKICSFTWALQRVRLFACSLLMSCKEASEL